MISNVPNTPSAPSEVQKLVRRFGTVIKTLVLNNMVRTVCLCRHTNLTFVSLETVVLISRCFVLRSFVKWQLQPWLCLSTNASRHSPASSRTTHCFSPASRTPRLRPKLSLPTLIPRRLVTLTQFDLLLLAYISVKHCVRDVTAPLCVSTGCTY